MRVFALVGVLMDTVLKELLLAKKGIPQLICSQALNELGYGIAMVSRFTLLKMSLVWIV